MCVCDMQVLVATRLTQLIAPSDTHTDPHNAQMHNRCRPSGEKKKKPTVNRERRHFLWPMQYPECYNPQIPFATLTRGTVLHLVASVPARCVWGGPFLLLQRP